LIVLAEYTNDAGNNFPPFSTKHPIDYYERLGFGQQQPPFSTENPVNPASLTGYFRECSCSRFWLEQAALIGPIPMGALTDSGPELRSRNILDRVEQINSRILFDADLDSDDIISSNEMLVLIFENIAKLQPANRDNLPLQIRRQIAPLLELKKTITLHVA